MTDIELTNSASDVLIYGSIMFMVVIVGVLVLHLYVLPALRAVYHKVAKALYWVLRDNHEAGGGRGYRRDY